MKGDVVDVAALVDQVPVNEQVTHVEAGFIGTVESKLPEIKGSIRGGHILFLIKGTANCARRVSGSIAGGVE